ncbi:MAG TPA: PAS domain-containing protein [Nitrospirae bacterium]|nr:sensor protein ZraS [bacterium BMS3Abin06]HDH12117.1 PAS domain-containing protein [Nitrospirota bacterium]HDZ02377.1 PAS domain-containing protein [Nitrospirota bacterium]
MHSDLVKRVSALINIRIIVVTILLGSFYIFEIGYDRLAHPASFSYFIAFLYFLTIVYALALRRIRTNRRFVIFAYTQIVIDIAAETALIYMTGGIDSMFAFLFPLSILSAGIVLNRRACYIFATLSSILYGLLLDLQFYSIIESSAAIISTEKDYFYNIFAHITAFYLVGYLSGYLSEKLHRATESLKERETVLSDLKAFSKYVIESMPSGIFTTDLNRRIISFNTAAQEITKLSHTDVAGKTLEDIFPFLIKFHEPLERGEGELQRGNETFPVGMRLSKLKDGSGKPIGLIGVFQDLTELKAMEAEVKRKEKWAFIGELSASIAHELRNPLASLKASVEMLLEKKVSGRHADHLMKIALSEMDRLNGIITDFLLYARPQELNKKPFDLNESLKNVITLLRSSETDEKDVTISANLNGGIIITGDSKQMQQVFWNLGLNALNAVSGGGNIEIFTGKNDSTNNVEITFRDSGTGISKDDIDRIFYPFFTTKEKGTGLGLSIARKITEEHGGEIMVESGGIGKGTTFRVILPLNGAGHAYCETP